MWSTLNCFNSAWSQQFQSAPGEVGAVWMGVGGWGPGFKVKPQLKDCQVAVGALKGG